LPWLHNPPPSIVLYWMIRHYNHFHEISQLFWPRLHLTLLFDLICVWPHLRLTSFVWNKSFWICYTLILQLTPLLI